RREGREVLGVDGSATILTDARGRQRVPRIDELVIEASGPVRATVRMAGAFRGGRGLRFVARLHFYAGTGLVKLVFTIHNPNRARHRGGLWDLGDPGARLFRDLSLQVTVPNFGGRHMSWIVEPEQTPRSAPVARLEIYQDSS